MVVTHVIALAAESGEEGGINPWFVGVGIFIVLAICLLAVVSFGAGRDHS